MRTCKKCKYGVDYGESVKYIYCERLRKKAVKKTDTCKYWDQAKLVILRQDTCVFCGEPVPEGIQVCPVCDGKYEKRGAVNNA